MPHSVEHLLDVEEDHHCVVFSVEAFGDVFGHPEKLMYRRVSWSETVLNVGQNIVCE